MLDKIKEKLADALYEGVNNLLYWTKGVKIIERYDVPHLIHSLELSKEKELKQIIDLSRLEQEGVAIMIEYVAEDVIIEQIKEKGYAIADREGLLEVARELWAQPKVSDDAVLLRVRYKGKKGEKPIDRWEILD